MSHMGQRSWPGSKHDTDKLYANYISIKPRKEKKTTKTKTQMSNPTVNLIIKS